MQTPFKKIAMQLKQGVAITGQREEYQLFLLTLRDGTVVTRRGKKNKAGNTAIRYDNKGYILAFDEQKAEWAVLGVTT
jgi:hypothetical protein